MQLSSPSFQNESPIPAEFAFGRIDPIQHFAFSRNRNSSVSSGFFVISDVALDFNPLKTEGSVGAIRTSKWTITTCLRIAMTAVVGEPL
jgi:hypothetical protein